MATFWPNVNMKRLIIAIQPTSDPREINPIIFLRELLAGRHALLSKPSGPCLIICLVYILNILTGF